MESIALWPLPPVIANVQAPDPPGVTINDDAPLAGEIVAIPLHEFDRPAAAVVAANEPLVFP